VVEDAIVSAARDEILGRIRGALRDVHTGVAQISMHWEVMALPYAQHAFGRGRRSELQGLK